MPGDVGQNEAWENSELKRMLDACWALGGPLNPEWDGERKVVIYTDLAGKHREEPAESLEDWMEAMLR